MADPNPSAAPAGAAPIPTPNASSATSAKPYKASGSNSVLRMMGLPALPKKLPSRNWMIFWALAGSFSAAIIYDKREKKRATARWSKAVSHLAREPLSNPAQIPRKLTIFLESPPADGLRPAQDHFTEYIKPILAASGLDWEFKQGRKEGDIRALVAERIRRTREPNTESPTSDELTQEVRRRNGTPEWQGPQGDIVVGRHAWKEYVRGLHEGWLGPVAPPLELIASENGKTTSSVSGDESKPDSQPEETEKKPEEADKKPEVAEKKPERPPQIPPYNSTGDYPVSALPRLVPSEFDGSTAIQFPHILGFRNTFIRLGRFLNRRHLADDVGREVAAACFAATREYQEDVAGKDGPEQQAALAHEEKDWPKSVWKEDDSAASKEKKEEGSEKVEPPTEKIWTRPVVLDSRVAARMRRFEIPPEEEARARTITVPEEEVEGWLKGSLRSLYRSATSKSKGNPYWTDDDDDN